MNKLRPFLPFGRFFMASEIIIGAGSTGTLAVLDASRMALLVSRTLSSDEKAMALLQRAAQKTVSTVIVMPSGEPTLTRLSEPLKAVTEFRPDWIVAVGGGAVLDGAKIVWALYEHPSLTPEQMSRIHALPPLRGRAKLAALPTTAGSGSEVSSTATFQFEPGGRKAFLVSHELVPDVAILDPTLMRGLSSRAFAAAGLDALAHAVEGYGSKIANPMTDALAETASRSILLNLPSAANNADNLAGRAEIMVAACFAGGVQNFAVPGLAHAMAHQFAAIGIPHGVSTGGLLAAVVNANAGADPAVGARYDRLANALGLSDGYRGVVTALHGLAESTGVHADLKDRLSGADWSDPDFVAGVQGDPCARANPITVDAALIETVARETLA
jgi:alcohol dehydrogenase class IV